jgi:SAM-dependent methyltransferase
MFDYEDYGAFKGIAAPAQAGSARRLAQRLGLRNRYLKFLEGVSRTQPLVEIGSGDGSFLVTLSDAGFQKLRGIEPSPSYRSVAPAGSIVQGYAQDYFEHASPASIGTVLALDVFEHIPVADLRRLLALIADRLVPGGTLVFRVPNLAGGLGLFNFHGDLSHTTALNEVSLRQLAYGTPFVQVEVRPEPLAYPRTPMGVVGLLLWLPYKYCTMAVLAAFGIKARILTPNLVCIMRKDGATPG